LNASYARTLGTTAGIVPIKDWDQKSRLRAIRVARRHAPSAAHNVRSPLGAICQIRRLDRLADLMHEYVLVAAWQRRIEFSDTTRDRTKREA
jgi:hypothetical protein